ncbi:MAG: hypothetical protein ACKOJ9_00905 [Actinomycetota bacterium]
MDDVVACRIADVSVPPDRPADSSSGFPRPEGFASANLVRVLAIPVGTGNDPFTDADRLLAEGVLSEAGRYFETVSYGNGRVEWSMLETDQTVLLSETSEELGLVGGGPTTGRADFVETVMSVVEQSIDVTKFDVVAVFLPAADKMLLAEAVPGDRLSDSGNKQNRILVGGGYAKFWQVFTHELGHAWLGLEDLYSFEQQSQFLGVWDIMQLALLATSPELTAWNRWLAGWLDDSQVRCVNDAKMSGHFVAAVEGETNLPQMVVIPTGANSAVVVETRRKIGYDQNGDLTVVYIVDTTFQSGQGPIRLVGELGEPGDVVESGGVRVTLLERVSEGDLIEVETN